jgi:hypothetical protein
VHPAVALEEVRVELREGDRVAAEEALADLFGE